jgi:TonB family protein
MHRTPYFLLALSVCVSTLVPGGALARGDDDARMRACVAALSNALSSRLGASDYPDELQKSDTQGTALVQLTIGRAGRVREIALAQTSGSAPLDRAALKGVERVFPAGSVAPSECALEAESLVTLPIRFELRRAPR